MKKSYIKPELGTKQYAQFENVFTACNKNPSDHFGTCTWNALWREGGVIPGREDEVYCHYKENTSSY